MPSPIPRLPHHLAADPRSRAEYRAVLAMRPAGQFSSLEIGQVHDLIDRMREVREIARRLAHEGLTVLGPNGRTLANPLVVARQAAETSIRRARAELGLTVSIGEARRHGRRMAEGGDDLGLRPDGLPTPMRVYALDSHELLTRPVNHDYAAERDLRARLHSAEHLCQAGEIEIDGIPKRGGVLWLDQVKGGMKFESGET